MDNPDPLQRLSPGMRAVVRHRVPGGLTDSVGTIEALDATSVTVRTRRGIEVIPVTEVTLAKEVPPRPTRRGAPHRAVSIDDLQRVMAAGWPAVEQANLGDWLLRASSGYTRRANSVLPVGDPGCELGAAVDEAERWYADRGLPCLWSLPGPLGFAERDDPLGAELLVRGYRRQAPTLVLTAATSPGTGSPGTSAVAPGDVVVRAHRQPTAAWWTLGDPRVHASAHTRVAAERIVVGAPEQLFLEATESGTAVAVVRIVFSHVWAGLSGLVVQPSHRHAGLATRLVAEAFSQARDRSIRSIYLQVEPGNDAALGLYQGLGFEPHHEYRYLITD